MKEYDPFDVWKFHVDMDLMSRIGMDSDDLEDWLWWDAFNEGQKPEEAVTRFLKYLGVKV